MKFVGTSSAPSGVKILSTIGSIACLPSEISRIAPLLKANIREMEEVGVTGLNQLIKLLYTEQIAAIKKQRLPTIIKESRKVPKAQRATEQNTPSCSLVKALEKQDLFINPAVTADG